MVVPYTLEFLLVHSSMQFAVCFLWSRYFVGRMSIALTIFLDFRHVAGATALCAPAGVLTALLPGSARVWKRSGCVWRFLDICSCQKAEFSHFRLLHFFGIFLLFVCQLAAARFVSELASGKLWSLTLRAF